MDKGTQKTLINNLFTSNFLSKKAGTDINNLRSIRENNDNLTSENKELVSVLGFKSFYDLCISTVSYEQEQLFKGGNKDFSKLTAVEQTVVRNGKPTKMKIYVNRNKENSESNELDSEDNSRTPVSTSELNNAMYYGDFKGKADPTKVKELTTELSEWVDTTGFSSNSQDYLEGRDESGVLRYLVGFTKKGKYITIDFNLTDGTVSGAWLTAFYQLIKLGLDNKLGVKYPDLKTKALYLLASEYNLKVIGKELVTTYEELVETVGDI